MERETVDYDVAILCAGGRSFPYCAETHQAPALSIHTFCLYAVGEFV